MNQLKNIFFLFLFFSTYLSAQPKLTLWRIMGESHDHQATPPEFYDCGSYYYFIAGTEGEVIQSLWSIKNEGNEDLHLDLPLSFEAGSGANFILSQQPGQSVLAPGQETHFNIQYTKVTNDPNAFLTFRSNDPSNRDCGMLLDGGIIIIGPPGPGICMCICNDMNKLEQRCTVPPGMSASGIPIFDGPCFNGNSPGDVCSPISIMDPCNCNSLVEISPGVQLFKDVLEIQTLPLLTLTLTENNASMAPDTSFLMADGTPFPVFGTTLGPADPSGIIQFEFYRNPGSGVSIKVDGVPFRSAACPSAASCATIIPTLSQWGLIILSLVLLTIGVISVRQVRVIRI